MEERTQEWQEAMLDQLVEPTFVKTDRNVKGPFTTGDYVTWLLNLIFGPDGWSSIVIEGPCLEKINPSVAYVQCVVRLTATFANGKVAAHDGPGVCLLYATRAKQGGTLEETSAEQYEMAIKGAETDGLKAAAERFGTCFRPLLDNALAGLLERKHAVENMHRKVGKIDESAEKSNNDLFGEEPTDPVVEAAKKMGGEVVSEEERPRAAVPFIQNISNFWSWALNTQNLNRAEIAKAIQAELGTSIEGHIAKVGKAEAAKDFAKIVAEELL